MTAFKYSWHVDLAAGATIGLLIWDQDRVVYFPHASRSNEESSVKAAVKRARVDNTVQEVVDYLLEGGGGRYQSFSDVQEVEADGLLAAARSIAHAHHQREISIPERKEVNCSACGSVNDLHLVTALIFDSTEIGRLLVYCAACRRAKSEMIGIDVPLKDVDVDFFVSLYRDRKTESDPETAAGIVFGEAPDSAVAGATKALAGRRR